MRVTQSMLSGNMLRNLSNSYERMSKLEDQIASQKKFTKPSDDPVAAMMGMTYRTNLSQIQQYSKNIGEAVNWMDSTDSSINQSISVLQRMRELTVQASNGTYESGSRESITQEIEQLKQQLTNISETQIGGKYIFNGQNTNTKPSVGGNEPFKEIKIEVFSGIELPINIDGAKLFGEAEAMGNKLLTALKPVDGTPPNAATISNMLSDLDKTIDSFLSTQAQVGAKQNRIELMEERLKQQEVFATEILSKNEDIDIEKAIMDLTTQESIHSAALSVGSRVIQPTLIDFLR